MKLVDFSYVVNRAHPMGEEEIIIVHKYLMKEWKINEKAGKRGPRGLTGSF